MAKENLSGNKDNAQDTEEPSKKSSVAGTAVSVASHSKDEAVLEEQAAAKPEEGVVVKKKKKKKKKNMVESKIGAADGSLDIASAVAKKLLAGQQNPAENHADTPVATQHAAAAAAASTSSASVPQLNLSSLATPGGTSTTAMDGRRILATPQSAPLPPPPPPSVTSSVGERRRSSVGVRLSLASIPEVAKGASESAPKAGSDWELFRDADNQAYYLHSKTGESRWANVKDTDWMEVDDPTTGCTYLEHAVTGETKWKKAENGTVWEEMKDPVTQKHYYYNSVAKDSQWVAPLWIDYICEETGCLYYFNTATKESSWNKPDAFAEHVEGGMAVKSAAAAIRNSLVSQADATPTASSSVATPVAMETPRNLPMATPRMVHQPPRPSMGGVAGGKRGASSERSGVVSSGVQYSMHKRPKTAPPKELEEGGGAQTVADAMKSEPVLDPSEASG